MRCSGQLHSSKLAGLSGPAESQGNVEYKMWYHLNLGTQPGLQSEHLGAEVPKYGRGGGSRIAQFVSLRVQSTPEAAE